MAFRAAVIGCGNIGGLCDSPNDQRIISHAHGYFADPRFELVAACDTSLENLAAFRQRWGNEIRGYRSLNDLLAQEPVDIVSVAVGTEWHGLVLKTLLCESDTSVILCEKPLVADLKQLNLLVEAMANNPDKQIMVNYQRHYDPGFGRLEKTIRSGDLGAPLYFQGVFSKGLFHNGSHLLELLNWLIGGWQGIEAFNCDAREDDVWGTFQVETRDCRGILTNLPTDQYWTTELDLFFERGLIRIADSGHRLEIHQPCHWDLYPGDSLLQPSAVFEDTLHLSMKHTLDHAAALIGLAGASSSQFSSPLDFSRKLLVVREQLANGRRSITFANRIEEEVVI